MSSKHHLRLKGSIPAWLWFPLFHNLSPTSKWNDEKEKIAGAVLKGLKVHLDSFATPQKEADRLLKPNPYDSCGMYGGGEPLKNKT